MNAKIIYDLPEEDYFKLEAFSQSAGKEILKSPAHYKIYKDEPQEETMDRDFYKAVHLMLLQPQYFDARTAVIDGHGATKAVKDARESARLKKKLVINSEKLGIIHGLRDKFKDNVFAQAVMQDAKTEVTLLWEHNRVPCKARLDILSPLGIYDLKGFDALYDNKAVGKHIHQRGYHRQLAHYRNGAFINALGDLPCGLIFYEPARPYSIRVTEPFNYAVMEKSDEELFPLIENYGRCLSENNWPGPSELMPIEFPYYGFN